MFEWNKNQFENDSKIKVIKSINLNDIWKMNSQTFTLNFNIKIADQMTSMHWIKLNVTDSKLKFFFMSWKSMQRIDIK